MSIKNLEIKPSEAKAVEVASLPTRPTSSATYGGRGLTAQQMKAAYDAYPALIKERFNALIADLLSGSALEDIPFTIPAHDPFGTGIENTVKAYLEYIGKIIDFENDSPDGSYKTVHEFVNTVVNDMANATTLDYDSNTRVLTLTIDGFEKAVTIEVDKYEKAIQQLNEQVASLEARKFDKAGGGILGDVNIGGSVYIGKDLTVAGNSTIQEAGHLKIKDAVIITNSDGEKLAVLSGLAIRKGENDAGVDETYGIMYDFASNSVKLGLVYTDENGNYQFLAGEGQPVATRADSAELTEHGIALWDKDNHRFIAKDMTDLDLTHGSTTVDYNTTDGMTINGQAGFTYAGDIKKNVEMSMEIPIVAGEGITIDKKAEEQKVEIKVEDGKYIPTWTPTDGLLHVYSVSQEGTQTHETYTNSAIPWSIVRRNSACQTEFGAPTEDTNAVTLGYANNHYVPIHNTGASYTVYGTVQSGGQIVQANLEFDQAPTTGTIIQRGKGGVVRVGTPVGANDATPKSYVDAQKTHIHYITITNENYDGTILLTIPNQNETPFGDLTELGNTLSDIGNPIMATGYLQPKGVTASQNTSTVYGITFDGSEQYVKALSTYQTITLTDGTITAATTHTDVPIQEDGYWTIADVVV